LKKSRGLREFIIHRYARGRFSSQGAEMRDESWIHVLHQIFEPSLPQLAPSEDASTRRALELIYGKELEGAKSMLRVLDLGCGNGVQSLRLAAQLPGELVAVDKHQPYLDELERRAAQQGLSEKIETLCADMARLRLGEKRFDLVWAEGSIYNQGVPEALTAWRGYLVPGGAVGFTELVWLEEGAPDECTDFFASAYPEMAAVSKHLGSLEECGYELLGHFTLPESAWLQGYFAPLRLRLTECESEMPDGIAREILEMCRREIEVYESYSRWFGYEFFVARLPPVSG
jgi:SAM-dependent methyltransferase